MPDITFDTPPSGKFQSYSEDGFTFTTEQGEALGLTQVLWNGFPTSPQGTGGYLINFYSQDAVIVRSTAGETFGATSIDLNGYLSTAPGTAQVTFKFTGARADFTEVHYDFTTDAVQGFENLVFPEAFAAGLTQLSWQTVAATPVWGGFDNLILTVDPTGGTGGDGSTPPVNHAPVAVDDTGSVMVDRSVTIDVLQNDSDGDANDQVVLAGFGPTSGASGGANLVGLSAMGATLTYDAGKIVYTANGAGFDSLPAGQTRVDTFYYTVTDLSGATSTAKVSVTVDAIPNGPNIVGGNRSQTLIGTFKNEKLFGGNSDDVLFGNGGADTLDGGNGSDVLWGGDGRDRLIGGNSDDKLDGGSGNDFLDGGNSSDTLTGGAGNDTMTGGNSADRFVFGVDFGRDVITDFETKSDKIQLSTEMFGNRYFDVIHDAVQTSQGVMIYTYDHEHSILLQGVKLSALNEGSFIFV